MFYAFIMNKVKKSRSILITKDGFPLEKWTWICCACNTEHIFRSKAQACNHKEYIKIEKLGFRWQSKIDSKIDFLNGDKEFLKEA